jgi:hypothetical protein
MIDLEHMLVEEAIAERTARRDDSTLTCYQYTQPNWDRHRGTTTTYVFSKHKRKHESWHAQEETHHDVHPRVHGANLL